MDDCNTLEARAEMLHREALLGLEQALDVGPASPTFDERIAIANRTEQMAMQVERRIAAECPPVELA